MLSIFEQNAELNGRRMGNSDQALFQRSTISGCGEQDQYTT